MFTATSSNLLYAGRIRWHTIIVLLSLVIPIRVCGQVTEMKTDFLETVVSIVSFDQGVTRFKLEANGAVVDVRSDIHIRLVENPNQLPPSFPILAPMTAVTVVQGEVPNTEIREYPLKHYIALREEYEKFAPDSVAEVLDVTYFGELNRWVEDGGDVDEIQSRLVENCGRLVMLHASPAEKLTLAITQREEFHFRVDVCTKMTVNRVHHQPEFENPETVKIICDESELSLFHELCKRSGFR